MRALPSFPDISMKWIAAMGFAFGTLMGIRVGGLVILGPLALAHYLTGDTKFSEAKRFLI